MSIDEIRTEAIALRTQRAGMLVKLANQQAARAKIDQQIALHMENIADMDAQIAENMKRYMSALDAAPASRERMRPLGENGEMIEVHQTTAWVFDELMRNGTFTITLHLNHRNHKIVKDACELLVKRGYAVEFSENVYVKLDRPCPGARNL